jgi:Fic family protein
MGFVPHPLPPRIDLGSISAALEAASLKLGELTGIGATLPNPSLLLHPLRRREAVSSSAIEGTYASIDEVLRMEAGDQAQPVRSETREVLNYVMALEHGIARLDELPLCLRLIRELHEVLMRDVGFARGAGIQP